VFGTRYQNAFNGEKCSIRSITWHPLYSSSSKLTNNATCLYFLKTYFKGTFSYDFALIHLNCYIEYTSTVLPALLPSSLDMSIRDSDNVTSYVAGWGRLSTRMCLFKIIIFVKFTHF
jgi:hypothetical protein